MNWDKKLLQKPMWKEEIKNREQKEQVAKKLLKKYKMEML